MRLDDELGRLLEQETFPPPDELARRLEANGFTRVWYRLFLGGVCAMHVGTRTGTA